MGNKRKTTVLILVVVFIAILAGLFYILNQRFHFLADSNTSADWAIYPINSQDKPIESTFVDIEIKNPTPGAKYYKVASVGTVGMVDQWISKTGQQIQIALQSSVKVGVVSLKISAWDEKPEKGGQLIREYPDAIDVDFDFSFSNLTNHVTLAAETQDNGDVKIRAAVDDQTLAPLFAEADLFSWSVIRPITGSGGSVTWKNDGRYDTDVPEIIFPVSQPTPVYVSIMLQNKTIYDQYGGYAGIAAYSQIGKIVFGVKNEDGSDPIVTPGFSDNVFISQRIIPGNMKLPLITDRVTIFSGGRMIVPFGIDGTVLLNPQYLEIDLPYGVTLNQTNFNLRTNLAEVSNDEPNLPPGYHRYRIEKINPAATWADGMTALYPTFPESMIGTSNLKIRLRPVNADQLGRSDNWQEQQLLLADMPEVTLPKRLVTSFTSANAQEFFLNSGANGNIDNSLNLYKKLGFNLVPNGGLQSDNPQTSLRLYTPEERQAEPWKDLKYGPSHALFYGNYLKTTPSLFKLYLGKYVGVTPEQFDSWADALDFNAYFKTNLTEPQLTVERTKWKNAIHFNIDSGGGIDMGYDGIFLQNDLLAIRNQMAKSKPEYIFLDSESFPSYSLWYSNIDKSANAQARKAAGESDQALTDRVVDEFVGSFAGAIRENSPDTKISLYGFTAVNTRGWNVITRDLVQKHNLIFAPSLYGSSTNLDQFGAIIRANRLVMPKGQEMIPYITNGCYIFTKSDHMFNEVVHTFLNGATGFSYFRDQNIDDMAHLIDMSNAIKLLSPHEDLIMDGDVAFSDISGTSNATVSAMKKDGQYLIGVTPKDKNNAVEFTVNTNKNQEYQLKDEKTGDTETVSGEHIRISKIFPAGTVVSLKPKADTSPIDSLNLTEGQVITTNPYILSLKLKDPADTTKVSKVEFYIDNTLISTSTLPDVSGTYQAVWDTSKYHSVVKVIVYNTDGTTETVTRNTTVNLSQDYQSPIVNVLPMTGETKDLIQSILGL